MTEHGKPSMGMSCLVTMEDITEDNGNYGKKQQGAFFVSHYTVRKGQIRLARMYVS